jgi:hypothetical protein
MSLRVDKKSPKAALGSGMIVLVSGLSLFSPIVGCSDFTGLADFQSHGLVPGQHRLTPGKIR